MEMDGREHGLEQPLLVRFPDGEDVRPVADDGVGFDVGSVWGKGLGLVSIGERVEAMGGTFEILSTPEAGTRVEVRVPQSPAKDIIEPDAVHRWQADHSSPQATVR